MDISNARCTNCRQPLSVTRMVCRGCNLSLEGEFEISPLSRLSAEDQIFVTAFVRNHGSIKKMEEVFGISYPTVKNRLNSITANLDRGFEPPSPILDLLEQIGDGRLSVDEAIRRMEE